MPLQYVNFGQQLAAEIVSLVWGTPANFNGFHVLAVLLHGTLVLECRAVTLPGRETHTGRQRNFAALNRGRHLYSVGRPSRWALAHILVLHALLQTTSPYYRNRNYACFTIIIIKFTYYIMNVYGKESR